MLVIFICTLWMCSFMCWDSTRFWQWPTAVRFEERCHLLLPSLLFQIVTHFSLSCINKFCVWKCAVGKRVLITDKLCTSSFQFKACLQVTSRQIYLYCFLMMLSSANSIFKHGEGEEYPCKVFSKSNYIILLNWAYVFYIHFIRYTSYIAW